MLSVTITGSSGRMGRALIETLATSDKARLHAAVDRGGSALLGLDAGEFAGVGALDVHIRDDLALVLPGSDALIDFTRPEATLHYLPCVWRRACRW